MLERMLFNNITQNIQTDKLLKQHEAKTDLEKEKARENTVLILVKTGVMEIQIQMCL